MTGGISRVDDMLYQQDIKKGIVSGIRAAGCSVNTSGFISNFCSQIKKNNPNPYWISMWIEKFINEPEVLSSLESKLTKSEILKIKRKIKLKKLL